MKITDSDYPADECILRKVPWDIRDMVGGNIWFMGLERLFVVLTGFLNEA